MHMNDEFVSATLYKKVIGSLRYLCNTMIDIYQSVTLLSIFIEKPQECHLIAGSRMQKYVKGTINQGVLMPRQKKTITHADVYVYTDSYFCGDQDEKNITTCYISMIGGALIS